ncbi:MAG: hypothetical protein HXY41_06815 [Chloroflexi bacterium]|nr:hypothetical protein [Chloroflexota bacterium]
MNVLIGYASAHGSTAEIAEFMGGIFKERGYKVTVAGVETINLIGHFDVIILGTAIHSGTWLPKMVDFMTTFQEPLAEKPVYLWINCIRVMEAHGYEYAIEYYMVHDLLKSLNVRDIAAFAGKLDLQNVDWNERWTLAARYDGATWPSNFNGDFRDWDKIRAWCEKVAGSVSAQA